MEKIDVGEMAWEIIDKKSKEKIKDEIFSFYDGSSDFTVEEISKKMELPVDIIIQATGELIDEGRVVEENVTVGDVISIVRQMRNRISYLENKISILENKLDIVAGGIAHIKKVVEKSYKLGLNTYNYINKGGEKHDGETGTVETENNSVN